MMLLSEAEKRVIKSADSRLDISDFGIDVRYAPTCRSRFTITMNDWKGRESTSEVHGGMIEDEHHLGWIIHDLIETFWTEPS